MDDIGLYVLTAEDSCSVGKVGMAAFILQSRFKQVLLSINSCRVHIF